MTCTDNLKKPRNEFPKIRWDDLEEVNKVLEQLEEEEKFGRNRNEVWRMRKPEMD